MNKQIRFTSESLSPLYKMSIGFDRLAEQFFNDPTFNNAQTGYPPYNIAKKDDDIYEVTLAVAGFKKDDIDISLEDGTLIIKGESNVLDESVEYLHKGIAERNFIRTFKLAEFVEVKEAKLEDGILRVSLFRNVPDALKPQSIKIT
jgi:molecular chaperone IbpA